MFSLKRLVKFAFYSMLLALIALLALYLSMRSELPSVESLKEIQWQTPMQIYSADGELISQFGEKKRIPLSLKQMPQQLIDAILATEDDRFYLHFGVDPIGMGRAVVGKLMGQNKGGASTITMQVARNFFLTREVTYTRKLREIFISFHIESLLSKDEILELYLNKIELGHRAFGFGAAAQVYYGKELDELTLAQIAVLAGLPKAPSTLNPIRSPKRAKERRSVVLQRMLVSGYITETEYQQANNAPITGKKHGAEITLSAPYIAEMAHQEMLERYGRDQAYTGGFKVFTTVHSKTQTAAQESVINNLYAYDLRHGYRGPIKQLRPVDEDVKPVTEPQTVEPLTAEEISASLKSIPRFHQLQPAVVTDVLEQSVSVTLSDGSLTTLEWPAISWAREYINDLKQGPAPKLANEILHYGDVVYLQPNKDGGYNLSQLPAASAALIALSPDDGGIKAAVGGYSFKQSQFNRVTQAKRQVGSNIKPFIYSGALEHGFTLASLVNDAPINQWDRSTGMVWRPKNSPPTYSGPIRVRSALAQSKNVVAVRLLQDVGLDKMIDHLSSFGFMPDELPRNESLALGSASLTPLEVAVGFAVFANGGYLVEPYLIDRIEDSFGNILYQASPTLACDDCLHIATPNDPQITDVDSTNDASDIAQETNEALATAVIDAEISDDETQDLSDVTPPRYAERVISAQNAFLITEALNSAIWGADWSIKPGWQGTGWRSRSLKRRDIAGKTGTTNEAKDAWFSGFSRRLVATSWIGFDDHRKNLGQTVYNRNLDKNQITGKEFGAKSAQPAWINFMKVALDEYQVEPFEQPQDVEYVRIDKASGKLTQKTDKSSLFEYFTLGTAPTDYVTQDISSEILEGDEAPIEEEIF